MELSKHISLATFRGNLESLVHELQALRRDASHHEGKHTQNSSSPTKILPTPTLTDNDAEAERTLNERLDRARLVEARQVAEKRSSALSAENAKLTDAVGALRREKREKTKQLQETTDKAATEHTGRHVLTTLVNTLRSNQSEITALLAKLDGERAVLEATVAAAETAASEAVAALTRKDQETTSLRNAIQEAKLEIEAQCSRLSTLSDEVSSLREAVSHGECSLEESRRAIEAAEAEQRSLRDNYKHQEEQIEATRREVASADERSETTAQALASVAKEFDDARQNFEKERSDSNDVLEALRVSSAEAEASQLKLQRELNNERIARQGLESERDNLTEALMICRQEKKEVSQAHRRNQQELESLKTKHERLLAATQKNKSKRFSGGDASGSYEAAPSGAAALASSTLVAESSLNFTSDLSGQFDDGSLESIDEKFEYMTPNDDKITMESQMRHSNGDKRQRGTGHVKKVLPSTTNLSAFTSVGDHSFNAESNMTSTGFAASPDMATTTAYASSVPDKIPSKKLKVDVVQQTRCPECSEVPYGLMAICSDCNTPYHTLCLPIAKRSLGAAFICQTCSK